MATNNGLCGLKHGLIISPCLHLALQEANVKLAKHFQRDCHANRRIPRHGSRWNIREHREETVRRIDHTALPLHYLVRQLLDHRDHILSGL